MANVWKTIYLLLALLTMAALKPRYIECEDSSQCPIGFCCMLGMGRFSLPKCHPLTETGNHCHGLGGHTSDQEVKPENVTVSYVNGDVIKLTNIYYLTCPCAVGLYCNHQRVCSDPFEENKENIIE